MNVTKREQEFEVNRRRYKEVQSGFKFSAITGILCTGVVFVIMDVYYIIRVFAMMVGADAAMTQAVINREMGEYKSSGLDFSFPYEFMAYLFVTTALSLASHFFKKRSINKLLLVIFALGALYGLVGMFRGQVGSLKGIYLLISGIYGTWIQSYVLRLHKELDHLSLQEGFPDFIPALAEPKTMANTAGLTRTKNEFLIRQRKEQKANGEEAPAPAPETMEMEELTLDTPLPKSNRKIDSMM